jgi:hypothetical protein
VLITQHLADLPPDAAFSANGPECVCPVPSTRRDEHVLLTLQFAYGPPNATSFAFLTPFRVRARKLNRFRRASCGMERRLGGFDSNKPYLQKGGMTGCSQDA